MPDILLWLRKQLGGDRLLQQYEELLKDKPKQLRWTNDALEEIEQGDPTHNKKYVQWLARMFANSNGKIRLEDIKSTYKGYLIKFDKLGKKKLLEPPYGDINTYKTLDQFMDTMDRYTLPESDNDDRGKYKLDYEDADVKVIIPEDETAAIFWGRGTRWCTSATNGKNYFESYNRSAPLYILLPKKAEHVGEKYQLHFYSNQYMDELDDSVSLLRLLSIRFPKLLDYFKTQGKVKTMLDNSIVFVDVDKLDNLIEQIKRLALDFINELISYESAHDEDFYDRLRDDGFVTEDGDIDWDRAPSYLEYNDDLRIWAKRADDALNISSAEIVQYAETKSEEQSDDAFFELPYVADIMAGLFMDRAPRGYQDYNKHLSDFLSTTVVVTNKTGNPTAHAIGEPDSWIGGRKKRHAAESIESKIPNIRDVIKQVEAKPVIVEAAYPDELLDKYKGWSKDPLQFLSATVRKLDGVVSELKKNAYAPEMKVFGSAANEPDKIPGDIDVFIDTKNITLDKAVMATALGELLRLCKKYYGLVDVFILDRKKVLWTRDSDANRWIKANSSNGLISVGKQGIPLTLFDKNYTILAHSHLSESKSIKDWIGDVEAKKASIMREFHGVQLPEKLFEEFTEMEIANMLGGH
jgi:predicted nucleotidyltransferase